MLIPWREAILVSGNAGVEAGRIPFGEAGGGGTLDDSPAGPIWTGAALEPGSDGGAALGEQSKRWSIGYLSQLGVGDGNRFAPVASASVQIGAGATAAIVSFALTDNAVSQCVAWVIVSRNGVDNEGASYLLLATFRKAAGVITQIGATTVIATHEDDATANAAFAINGASIEVRGTTPAAKTYDWRAYLDLTQRT